MTSPGLIDRQGLLHWADSIGARSALPRLIRRLILETGQGIARLGFPAGEGVSLGGWDGIVYANTTLPFVPEGLSLWELSVNKSPRAKADHDYSKRTTTPDGTPTDECTYVAVSLRPWTQREDWAQHRSSTGRWKEVRALGVDDIDAWLESCPVTHAWLSEKVGLQPYGLVTAQTWWQDWSSATTPAFPSAIVTSGRAEAAAELRNRLGQEGQIVTIRGSSPDEVLAFIAALGQAEEPMNGEALLARTAFIDRVETWRRLRGHKTPLVLVARTEEVASEFTEGTPHVLIVPRAGSGVADIELQPIDSLIVSDILRAEGVPEREAVEVGKLARLSLIAARRRLARKPELYEPAWARTPATKTVRRMVLVGRWRDDTDTDRDLVEKVASIPYDELREEIAALVAGGDPLLVRLGGALGVVSHFDAWLLLRVELRKDDLEFFHETTRTVFSETDPNPGRSQLYRWTAATSGGRGLYSPDLRRGLATTLALLGSYGNFTPQGASITGSEWAGWIIREVLEAANGDATCSLWVSLADVMSLFAEAAPSEFLEAVRVGVGGDAPVLANIFGGSTQDGSLLWPSSQHCSLLWALEICAWSSDHFGLVVDLLARLDEIDSGGQLSNRPLASLIALFLPWYPQNSVPVERRLAAIDGLRERHQTVSWKLLLSLLPGGQRSASDISAPRFRDWKPNKIEVSQQQKSSYVEGISSRVLADVDRDSDRWLTLIKRIDDLPPHIRSALLEKLNEADQQQQILDPETRTAIWEALRSTVARHRNPASADWALPEDQVAVIDATATRLAPADPRDTHRWLFERQMPDLPQIDPTDFPSYEDALAKLRKGAVVELAKSNDWSNLKSFALSTPTPWLVGSALAQGNRHEHETHFLELFDSADENEVEFAAGYFSRRCQAEGWEWLVRYLEVCHPTPLQAARLLLHSRDYPRAWEQADNIGTETVMAFWRNFSTVGLGADFEYVDLAARRLLDTGRPGAALDLVSLYRRQQQGISSERAALLAESLEAIQSSDAGKSKFAPLSQTTNLAELFKFLEGSELDSLRLAKLEWAFLPVFERSGGPPTLGKMLSQDPSFFVDIIKRVFRPRATKDAEDTTTSGAETAVEPEEEERLATVAKNAYRLLANWRRIPGQREDGSVDADVLKEWVTQARQALEESGRREVGDIYIGHTLARGPTDVDGSLVGRAVRDLLEILQSPDIEDGLRTDLSNSRGVTTRSLFEGGDQERDLAAHYFEQAERFSERWPRTAAILRQLAKSYERDGRRYDEDAEHRRRGM